MHKRIQVMELLMEAQAPIEEAPYHQNEPTSWRPKMSKYSLLHWLFLSQYGHIFLSNFIRVDACILDVHFKFKWESMYFRFCM